MVVQILMPIATLIYGVTKTNRSFLYIPINADFSYSGGVRVCWYIKKNWQVRNLRNLRVYLMSSTLRLRKASRAAPLSIPFWRRARSMSWWMMLLPLA